MWLIQRYQVVGTCNENSVKSDLKKESTMLKF